MKGFLADVLKVALGIGALLGLFLFMVLTHLSGFTTAPQTPPAVVSTSAPTSPETLPTDTQPFSQRFLVWVFGPPTANDASAQEGKTP